MQRSLEHNRSANVDGIDAVRLDHLLVPSCARLLTPGRIVLPSLHPGRRLSDQVRNALHIGIVRAGADWVGRWGGGDVRFSPPAEHDASCPGERRWGREAWRVPARPCGDKRSTIEGRVGAFSVTHLPGEVFARASCPGVLKLAVCLLANILHHCLCSPLRKRPVGSLGTYRAGPALDAHASPVPDERNDMLVQPIPVALLKRVTARCELIQNPGYLTLNTASKLKCLSATWHDLTSRS